MSKALTKIFSLVLTLIIFSMTTGCSDDCKDIKEEKAKLALEKFKLQQELDELKSRTPPNCKFKRGDIVCFAGFSNYTQRVISTKFIYGKWRIKTESFHLDLTKREQEFVKIIREETEENFKLVEP